MKNRSFVLSACIGAALSGVTVSSMAAPAISPVTLAGLRTGEAPRVVRTIDPAHVTALSHSHFGFLGQATASISEPGDKTMGHMQLVLRPSAMRKARMEAFITSQHDPKSVSFQQWLTPQQFGAAFGVEESDVAAAVAWLKQQGFTVNHVYPNKTQIDFSGTVEQINKAFHTQERLYSFGDEKHLANATDISIPQALQPIVAGVMGLNDFHAVPLNVKKQVAHWDAASKRFVAKHAKNAKGAHAISQAVPFGNDGSVRGLVPNDLMTMYGIREIRANGVTGKNVTIAVVEDEGMDPGDWPNFVETFNLGQYGGTFSQIHPAPGDGGTNCQDPDLQYGHRYDDSEETLLDAEWATAIAPGAHVEVASCSNYVLDENGQITDNATTNPFGGVFIAANNLINGSGDRPNIISASYGLGEFFTDDASKTAIDLMWAQADAEGISVFVSTGDSGSNANFNGSVIHAYEGITAIDTNSLATSPHVTAVGGTDTADVLDGTTSRYFAATPSVVGGSALSYVPEIPWNESCGNGVAAKAYGYGSAVAFCQAALNVDRSGVYLTSEASSGGPSMIDAKPDWQKQVYNAAQDQSRDIPDVSLFAGSYGKRTFVVTCTAYYSCSPEFSDDLVLSGGTSLSSPLFAGVQALIDQGLADRGASSNQGNAAPTLYALAAKEYGTPGVPGSQLASCNADNGTQGTENCVFHNITRGSISSECYELLGGEVLPNCYFLGSVQRNTVFVGLTAADATPTAYGTSNKAYGAQPGWSFASGLGSVNTKNLLIAWRAFVHAPSP
jgi:subtilase family serine protease